MKSKSFAPLTPSQLARRRHLALHVANGPSRHVDRGSGRQIALALIVAALIGLSAWIAFGKGAFHVVRHFHADSVEVAR